MKPATRRLALAALAAAGILAAVIGLTRALEASRPGGVSQAELSEGAAKGAVSWRSPAAVTTLAPTACDGATLADELRAARSPAYRRYLARSLADGALSLDELLALFDAERDPAVLEAIAGAIVARANSAEDPSLLRPLIARLSSEQDAALRAAIVRAVEGTVEPSSQVLATLGTSYEHLIRDAAPEVRRAVVDNLLAENARGHGRFGELADAAVATVAVSTDGAEAARLLGGVSIEAASAASVERVRMLLGAETPEVRAAAATALGSAGASEARRGMRALVDQFHVERDAMVRKALVQAIARIGFAEAAPVLASLRGLSSAAVEREIELWLAALATGRQTWTELLREKTRLEQAQGS